MTGRPRQRTVEGRPLPGGEVHSVYEVWEGAGSYVLKVYREELRWKLDKEAYLLLLVSGRGLPVPEVLEAGPGFLVMTRLPGMLARGSDADPLAVARELGGVLRELHRITFDSFGYIETGVTEPASTNAEYMRRRAERKIANAPPGLQEALAHRFAAGDAVFAGCDRAVLCHNDAHDANVLVEDGRITGLLDWENAVAADPVLDLAKAWAFFDGRSEETLEALADGYGPLRTDWREAFDLYVLDHLLELWIWLAREGVTEPLPRIEAALARLSGLDSAA